MSAGGTQGGVQGGMGHGVGAGGHGVVLLQHHTGLRGVGPGGGAHDS